MPDDAAVYELSKTRALVATLDFFTPVVDDPYDFGAIAAANALSDIYAMGADPMFALNILAYPCDKLPKASLKALLRGGADKALEAGIVIAGGHSVTDDEPKYGLCVLGEVHPKKMTTVSQAKAGDVLILTKALGTGIIATAVKRGKAVKRAEKEATASMAQLNKDAALAMRAANIRAATDVTGYGLLGHLHSLTQGSGVSAELWLESIPLLRDTRKYLEAGHCPGGSKRNLGWARAFTSFDKTLSEDDKLLLADAQTSGGLLLCVPKRKMKKLRAELKKRKVSCWEIGVMTAAPSKAKTKTKKGRIRVLP